MGELKVSSVRSVTVDGVAGVPVLVECTIGSGVPADSRVLGLASPSVKESVTRIRSALSTCGPYEWKPRKVTFNLAPAEVKKQGSGFDLAFALAILVIDDVIRPDAIDGTVFFGELTLNGRLQAAQGALPVLLAAARDGARRIVLPSENRAEASIPLGGFSDMEVFCAPTLRDVYQWLTGGDHEVERVRARPATAPRALPDLAEVKGQPIGKRALEVAAAGGHHLMFGGPPGAGKTMLAKRMPGILPMLSEADALTVTSIRSVTGHVDKDRPLHDWPPFEDPHHNTSVAALIGGGTQTIRPGIISRAHRGVLFIDEAPEFKTGILDQLRQPLETGLITVSRQVGAYEFPARFQLILAANPCPCAAGSDVQCVCTSLVRRRYQSRISGPILDRIDIVVDLLPPTRAALLDHGTVEESSAAVAERVAAARARSAARWVSAPLNCDVDGKELRRFWQPDGASRALLSKALETGSLTGRGYERVLRVSWSLCDLAGHDKPTFDDVAEALAFRSRAFGVAA